MPPLSYGSVVPFSAVHGKELTDRLIPAVLSCGAQELEEDDDDSYLDSEWANPRGLKNALIGGGREIRWKY